MAVDNTTNPVAQRIADFLGLHPPFNLLQNTERFKLALKCKVDYAPSGQQLFTEGQNCLPHLYVLRSGSVEIYHSFEGMLDLCDEGDVFGARGLVSGMHYLASAKVREAAVLYVFELEPIKNFMAQNGQFAWFFLEGLAGGKYKDGRQTRAIRPGTALAKPYDFTHQPKALTLGPESKICEAAIEMSALNASALVVTNRHKAPIGIVTDRDLRRKVATGLFGIHEPITQIMSQPVFCMPTGLTESDYLSALLEKGFRHLCITHNGETSGNVEFVLSEHDLLVSGSDNPAVLLRRIQRCQTIWQLSETALHMRQWSQHQLQSGLKIRLLNRYAGILRDALVRQCIQVAIEETGGPPSAFAWLELGSYARCEQILATDQDHALVYEGHSNQNQNYFIALAKSVESKLEACGYSLDQAGVHASNAPYCLEMNAFKNKLKNWFQQPDGQNILEATILLDFRPIYGEPSLGEELEGFIQANKSALFMRLLAADCLRTPPPMGFFKNLILEKDGSHKDAFDLKLRSLLPFTDIARLLAIEHGMVEKSTVLRYKALEMALPQQSEMLAQAAEAVELLLSLRFESGLKNNDDGRYVPIEQIDKLKRQMLRNAFTTLSDLQLYIKQAYQTDLLRA